MCKLHRVKPPSEKDFSTIFVDKVFARSRQSAVFVMRAIKLLHDVRLYVRARAQDEMKSLMFIKGIVMML